MKNRTLRVIIILISLLFLNIEAAHAGLIHKLKSYIRLEFTDFELFYIFGGSLSLAFLGYVIFTPVLIGNKKWAWLNYYSYQPNRHDYQSKRDMVKKISGILKNDYISNSAHS